MPRIGMNPNRDHKTEYHPARVTLAMLTCLPEEAGYFEHRFDSMRVSLESLIAITPQPCDLLVFDNGSCPRFVDYLRDLRNAGKIQYLILSSRNIGKIGALKIMYHAAPGELIAYGDDDMFYVPGWLEESLRVIECGNSSCGEGRAGLKRSLLTSTDWWESADFATAGMNRSPDSPFEKRWITARSKNRVSGVFKNYRKRLPIRIEELIKRSGEKRRRR